MSLPISLHVLCRHEGLSPKGLLLIDKAKGIYESTSWRVPEALCADLVDKTFAMHESKGQSSYFGGEIISIDRRPIEDNDGEVRAVVTFRATIEGKGLTWPPTDNPNEYHRINLSTPLADLQKGR